MAKSFSDLIQLTIKEMSQLPGTGVQLYAEDIVAAKLQTTFNMVLDELWWGDYMQWFGPLTPDGVTGIMTTDLTGVKRYDDIRAVFRIGTDRKLPQLPRDVNPYNLGGSLPRFIEALAETTPARIFRVWPLASTSQIFVHARLKPDDFNSDSTVKMDEDVLKLGASWQYLEDDGTNPAAASKQQGLFESRLKQLKKMYSNKPISLDPRVTEVPTEWWQR